MSSKLYYPPTQNALQKTLGADLNTGVTSSMTLNNTTGVQNKPGVVVVDRIDTSGTLKSTSVREWIIYQGTSGSTLTTLTRGVGGSTDQDHSTGAVVEFVPDITMWQAVIDDLANLVDATTGALDTTKVVDLTTSQTLINKLISTGSSMAESLLTLTDITTNDVSTSKHGFTPKAPNDTTKFLRGDATWAVPTAGVASDGWVSSSDTWTYVSATSFKISGADRTTTFTKGTKIKFTQTTVKYFVVVSSTFSTDTTVTIAANDDYTLANASITSPYYSYEVNPQGWPGWFNFTSTFGGFSANQTPVIFRYSVHGKICYMKITATANGTSNSTSFTFTMPIAAGQTDKIHNAGRAVDNGTVQQGPAMVSLTSASATATLLKYDESGWTGSGNKSANIQFFYEI